MMFFRLQWPGYSALADLLLELEEGIRLVAVVFAEHDLAFPLELLLEEPRARGAPRPSA